MNIFRWWFKKEDPLAIPKPEVAPKHPKKCCNCVNEKALLSKWTSPGDGKVLYTNVEVCYFFKNNINPYSGVGKMEPYTGRREGLNDKGECEYFKPIVWDQENVIHAIDGTGHAARQIWAFTDPVWKQRLKQVDSDKLVKYILTMKSGPLLQKMREEVQRRGINNVETKEGSNVKDNK